MAIPYQPIPMMGEQFNPMDSLAQTAQLQAAYQQNQMRAMQIAEMKRQQQEANAQRQAGRYAATYAPSTTTNSPTMTLGDMVLPNITPQTQVQGPAGADFRNQYVSQLGKLGQGQMIPGAQNEFAMQDAARAKLVEEQRLKEAETRKNNSEANKFDADTQAKHIDMLGAAANALIQLPDDQASAAYPVTVAMLRSQGVDTSKFPPQFDRGTVTQAAQLAVSAKEQLTLKQQKEKNDADLKTHTKDTAQGVMQFNPATGKYDQKIGELPKTVPSAVINTGRGNDARMDKSYQFNASALTKISDPVEQLAGRVGRLQETLSQATPQADAFVAPEALTIMAGGQGSGLRMNEAEISRIVGGRSAFESLKASLNKYQLDPSKANSITSVQRAQIGALVEAVNNKLMQKRQVVEEANQALINAPSVDAHRTIVANARKALADIDAGTHQAPVRTGGGAQGGRPPLSAFEK